MNRIADLFEDLFGEGLELPRNALRPAQVERLGGLVRTGATIILPTGEVLGGRFKISELVGVGSSGLVYTAADQRGGWKSVAVKAFHPGLGDAVRPRLTAAVDLLEGQHHRAVSSVIALGEHGGQFYVVSEHVPTTLATALADGAVGLRDAWTLFDGVLDGLAFLHHAGLAHGDLKPSNVLLRMGIDSSPEPVLSDWAQLGDPDDGIGSETLFHMPPEQVDDPLPALPHDVYAAGVLLFQLLAGRHPLDLDAASKILTKYLAAAHALAAEKRRILAELVPDGAVRPVAQGGAQILAGAYREMIAAVPRVALPRRPGLRNVASLDLILRKAMHPDPALRYAAVDELRADLVRNKADELLEGVEEPRPLRTRKWLARNRERLPRMIAAAAAVFVIVAALGYRATRPGAVAIEVPDHVLELAVRVDGEELSARGLASRRFGPGAVSLEVVTEGWRLDRSTVDVPARGEVAVGLIREHGKVGLATTPPGARFVVQDGPRDPVGDGWTTPFEGELPTGRYTGTVRATGYLAEAFSFHVRADAPVAVERTLREVVERRVPIPGARSFSARFGAEGRVEELLVATPEGLQRRSADDGQLLSSVAFASPPVAWLSADLDGRGSLGMIAAQADGALVARAGPDLGPVRWRVAGAGGGTPPVLIEGAVVSVSADGVARAFEVASGELRWERALPAAAAGPLAAHDGAVFVPGANSVVYALEVADGGQRWSARRPSSLEAAASWLELSEGRGGVLVGGRDGGFALIDAAAGIPVRMGRGELIAPAVPLPTWHDGTAWRRLRLAADSAAVVEDLTTGVVQTILGRFAGPVHWTQVRSTSDGARLALVAGPDALWVFRFVDGAPRGTELAVLTANVGPGPLVYAVEGALRVAWLGEGELLFATLTTADQRAGAPLASSPAGAVGTLPPG